MSFARKQGPARPSLEELQADPALLPVERLELQIRTHAAHMAIAMSRFLALVAEYDRRKAYESWECQTCARWLELHCQVCPSAAHEYVRVARALEELPAVAAAFSSGEMSYSKVRAITRVATAVNEDEMLGLARSMNAAQLTKVCRAIDKTVTQRTDEQMRRVERLRGAERHPDGKGLVTWVLRMSEEEDAALQVGIQAARDRAYAAAREAAKAEGKEKPTPAETKMDRLEALLAAVEAGVANETGEIAERYLTIINVDADQVADDGRGAIVLGETGIRLHPSVARRLACDTAIQLHVTDNDGGVRMGRRIRTFTKKQRQLIAQHYNTCGFPGCNVDARRCQFHHFHHWTDGGPTDVDNGIPLCRKHHRSVHREGWRLWRDTSGTIHAESLYGDHVAESLPLPGSAIREYTGLENFHDWLGIEPPEPWQQFELASRAQLRYITSCALESPTLGFLPNPDPPVLN